MKDFLRDDENLSTFLLRNASLPEDAVKEIVEAEVNLEKVTEREGEKKRAREKGREIERVLQR